MSLGDRIFFAFVYVFCAGLMFVFLPLMIYSAISIANIHNANCTAAGGIHYKPSYGKSLCFKPDSLIDIRRD